MYEDTVSSVLRPVLSDLIRSHKDKPLYVAGSHLFTAERLAKIAGFKEIHSNDFTLPACLMAWHSQGEDVKIEAVPEDLAWLNTYLAEPGIPTIAAVLLFCDMLQYYKGSSEFHKRYLKQYLWRFDQMHKQTQEFIKGPLADIKITSFTPGGRSDFIFSAPNEAAVICPPISKSVHGPISKQLNEIFNWPMPKEEEEDEEDAFFACQEKAFWIYATDKDMEIQQKALLKQSKGARPINVYAGEGRSRLVLPRMSVEPVPYDRLYGEMEGDLNLAKINAAQLNFLRAEYLNPGISPIAADISFAVLVGDKLIGAIGFSKFLAAISWNGDEWDAYLLADFCIRPSIYRRLSKLILVAVLSKEVQTILEQVHRRKIPIIGTTIFSEKDVSMKYRGMFEMVARRDDGRLIYTAKSGQWTLQEGFEWWKKNHAQIRAPGGAEGGRSGSSKDRPAK